MTSSKAIETYILEVYGPDDSEVPVAMIESSSPFLSIHPGDFLHANPWADQFEEFPGILRITRVEHLVEEFNRAVLQKVMVFTERERGSK